MKTRVLGAAASALAFTLAIPSLSHATNGYFLIGYGAKSRAIGGAGIAYPQDSLAAASNPAGMAVIGTRFDIGAEFFNPPRSVSAENGGFGFATNGVAHSGSNMFLIPSMGGNYQFSRRVSIGMSAIGNGANTRYSQNFFDVLAQSQPNTLGVQLIQMQMLPTVSYKYSKQHAFGASLAIGVQTFRAYGLGDFAIPEFQFSSDVQHLTNQGNDWSYGAGIRLGYLGTFAKGRFNVGLSYASKVYMTKFDKYRGLFAQQGSFDIPEHFGIGFAFKPTDKTTLVADVHHIRYSDIPAVGNRHPTTSIQGDVCTRPIGLPLSSCAPGRSVPPEPTSNALGAENSWGFGWKDATAYKIGVVYELNPTWTLRAGYNYGKSVIPDDQLLFNMLAPAIVEHHLTAGFTYSLSPHSEINMNVMHGFENSQACDGPSCKTMLTQDEGQYVAVKMKLNSLGISYSFKF